MGEGSPHEMSVVKLEPSHVCTASAFEEKERRAAGGMSVMWVGGTHKQHTCTCTCTSFVGCCLATKIYKPVSRS